MNNGASTSDFSSDSGELVILSVLSEEPRYGYSIAKEVSTRSDGKLRLTPGVLYPLLKQLETDGLVTGSWETVRSERGEAGESDEEGGRRRKWYKLSAKGRRRLAQRVAAHRAFRAVIDLFIPDGRDSEERGAAP